MLFLIIKMCWLFFWGIVGMVFVVRLSSDHDLVSNRMGVDELRGVFSSVVLEEKLLLLFLDVLPIGLKRHVEDGVLSEDELCGRGSCGCVDH